MSTEDERDPLMNSPRLSYISFSGCGSESCTFWVLLPFFFFLSFFTISQSIGLIMLAAVQYGEAKELAELIQQDPGFNVNMDHGNGNTFLHLACCEDSGSAVIPLLLAHPGVDVNVKDGSGNTPFMFACYNECTSCVREMLKDSRMSPTMMDPLHSGGLLVVAPFILSSGGSPLEGRWISGTRGCRRDGCHWGGKEGRRDRSGDPAGEI